MKKRRLFLGGLIALLAVVVPGSAMPQPADAQETYTLRFATLAPRGSSWMKVFNAWNATLKDETDGRLKLEFYPSGVQGDESDFVRKMRAGQLEGAAITGVGLGLVVRSVLVLQLPGLIDSYEMLDKVRRKLDDSLEKQFEKKGYKLLGWGDAGKGRIFSQKPIRKPSDLKKVRPWAWSDDVIFTKVLKTIGANPIRLGVPEVYSALQTGTVDTIPASSLAAVSMQWFTKLNYVTDPADFNLIGATILRKKPYDNLPEDLRKKLMETSDKAHEVLTKRIRQDDRRAFKTMLNRGIKKVDVTKHEKKWAKIEKKVQEDLAGRLYPRSLLERVKKVVQ